MNEGFNTINFLRPNGGRVQLPEAIVVSFRDCIQIDAHKPESGGVLLGRYILGTCDIVIDKVTFPMPGDKSTRTTFFRKKQTHQEVIDREWKVSDGTCTYLGEWHTHPERVPSPSCIDRYNWHRKLKKDIFDSDSLFFLIIGTEEIKLWEGSRKSMHLEMLKTIPD